MSQVTSDLTISLDGFAAGPNQSLADPLGEGGKLLHRWQIEEAQSMQPSSKAAEKLTGETKSCARKSSISWTEDLRNLKDPRGLGSSAGGTPSVSGPCHCAMRAPLVRETVV